MGACTGFKVLEIAEGVCAASLCGQLFAGLGAEVVKVESGAGDPLRSAGPPAPGGIGYRFHLTNAAKQSAFLDGGAVEQGLEELARPADVVLLGPLTSNELCLAARRLSATWPNKIVCAVTPFGEDGERSGWRGSELITEAMGGLLVCTGYPERPPVVSGIPFAEHIAALFAFSGILAALWERKSSGQGQHLDIAVSDCLVSLLGNFIPAYFLSGRSPRRIGNRHTIAAPWNLYPSSDGHLVICVGGGTGPWWRDMTRLIGRPELFDDERFDHVSKRVEHVDEVDALVSAWTSRHPTAEVVKALDEYRIPVSEIASVESVLANPQYNRTRAMIGWSLSAGKPVAAPGLPLKVGAWTPPPKPGPALGSFRTWEESNTMPGEIGRERASNGAGSLAGIHALEFGSRTSVPMSGRLLADLGAEVVKIEPGKGESLRASGQRIAGSSYLFHINNAGKESVVIEPKSRQGRELILRLAEKADVWCENLAPGSLDAMGLGYADLKAVNPAIVYCSVSGFGRVSDYGNKKALDTVVQAATGLMHLTGYPDHLPVKLGISAIDLAVAVSLTGAVLAALHERRRTGKGQHIDLAMADVGVWLTQSVWPEILTGSGSPMRQGNSRADACPHGLFATQDGFLALAVENDAQWVRFAELLGGELRNLKSAELEARLCDRERIEASVGAWSATRTAAEAAEALQRAGVPAAPMRNVGDIVEDPETVRRELVVEVSHPTAGAMRLLGTPLRLSRTRARVSSHAPLLGEHTEGVFRRWLGMSDAELEKLLLEGVVAVSRPGSAERKEPAPIR